MNQRAAPRQPYRPSAGVHNRMLKVLDDVERSESAPLAPLSRDGDVIWVQNNYPFRLPRFAAVGIDQPIISQGVSDTESLERFLNQATVYSCTKNQARHRNRWGILQQALMPGEIGKCVMSAATKAVFYYQEPPNGDEIANLPADNIESSGDDYRHLGIVAATWNNSVGVGGAGTEAEYTPGDDGWGIRHRPHWLFPHPRETDVAANNNSDPPYDSTRLATSHGRASALSGMAVNEILCTGSSTVTCINQRWQVTESDCSSLCSTWPVIEARLIAQGPTELELPCIADTIVTGMPCAPELPAVTAELGSQTDGYFAAWGVVENGSREVAEPERFLVGDIMLSSPRESANLLSAGATDNVYQTCSDITHGTAPSKVNRCCANVTCTYTCDGDQWVVARGDEPWVLDKFQAGYETTTTQAPCTGSGCVMVCPEGGGEYQVQSSNCSGPGCDCDTEAAGTCTAEEAGNTVNVGCTQTSPDPVPHYEYIQCVCPDAIIADRADFELPCGENTQPREFTIGMIYSTTSTTSTSTSTSSTTTSTSATTTTTTAFCGYCEYLCQQVNAVPTWVETASDCESPCVGCNPPSPLSCDAAAASIGLTTSSYCIENPSTTTTTSTSTTTSGSTTSSTTTSTSSTTTTTTGTGACCDFQGICLTDRTEDNCVNVLGGTYQGNGTDCEPDPCGTTSTTTSTTTTSTTTTASTTSSTTTSTTTSTSSTTTTTAEPTGACCVPGFEGGYDCQIHSEEYCTSVLGIWNGNGSTCSPNPCPTTTTTSTTTTTTAAPEGACCFMINEAGCYCTVGTVAECGMLGGTYRGDNTDCSNYLVDCQGNGCLIS